MRSGNAIMYFKNLLLLSGLGSMVVAQQSIIPSNQPACIQQCGLFKQAQDACASQQAVAAQYQSCFCQSGYLKPVIQFATTPAQSNSVCPNCPQADWTTISSWYNGFCGAAAANPAAAAPNGQTTTTTAAAGAGAATTTTPTTAGGTTAANTGSQLTSQNNPANYTDGASWFKGHWQWVVMIIVLAVAFTAIGVFGTILHKRKSKARLQGSNYTAPMTSNPAVNSWAPSRHSVHDFGTPRAVSPTPAMPAVVAGPSDSRRQSRRLGKSPSLRV